MCNHHHLSPVQCIIPPYINDKLMVSDNKLLMKIAANNRYRTHRLNGDREFFRKITDAEKVLLYAKTASKPKPVKQPKLEIYNCKKKPYTTGATLLWKTGATKAPVDKDAKNAIKGGEATWRFYYDLFSRNSIDNLGMTIKQFIHYDNKFDNAFWNGKEMIFGDGDGKIFGNFTSDIDIIGHELTHGVTQYEANLEYHLQAGALNEAISDIFGIMIKQRLLNQDVKQSNWLIGENVLKGNNYALRSMKAPGTAYTNHPDLGTDPQPATMDSFVKLPDTYEGDWGGVHYNSGICNFAFYVMANNMGGFAWEKAGRIWYAALTDKVNLKQNATFKDIKKLTIVKAEDLFGKNSLEAKAVKGGWDAAKV